MLRIDALTKRFGDKTAVNSATIAVDAPSMIGVIGRSGAGKSTLLRMVNRLSDASSGTITFEGEDITSLKGGARRNWQSRCAMIFQQFNLVPRMDVVSNVLHGTLNRRSTVATLFNLYPQTDIHQAIEILDRLGIAEQAPKRAEALSGGQQQRVAIARALMQDPKIILADEPIASLDPMNAQASGDAISAHYSRRRWAHGDRKLAHLRYGAPILRPRYRNARRTDCVRRHARTANHGRCARYLRRRRKFL